MHACTRRARVAVLGLLVCTIHLPLCLLPHFVDWSLLHWLYIFVSFVEVRFSEFVALKEMNKTVCNVVKAYMLGTN